MLNPTDNQTLSAAIRVLAENMRRAGIDVELATMGFATLEPVRKTGGRSLHACSAPHPASMFHTCYNHLAGKLAVAMADAMVEQVR